MSAIVVENHGPIVLATNYWESPAAKAGKLYVSSNAGAFRILIPSKVEEWIAEMTTAKEVIFRRGAWPEMRLADAFDVVFDDRTQDPFCVKLATEAFDRMPDDASIGQPWTCSGWTDRRGKPRKVFERPAHYRKVARIDDPIDGDLIV